MRQLHLVLITLILGCVGLHAEAYTASKKVLVSVGDLKEVGRLQWRKEICAQLHVLANQVSDDAVDFTCRAIETTDFQDKTLQELRVRHDYHLRVMRDRDGQIHVDATNWNRKSETDFATLGWSFKDDPTKKISKEDAFLKAMANFFYYAANDQAFKAGLLVNGVSESSLVSYDQKTGTFHDRMTGQKISVSTAYKLFESESPRKKNYLRTGIQIGVLLSAGMAIYYKNLVYNETDFDYGFREGLKKKFNGEALLFDDNDKFANYGHVYAGVLYYQSARSNGFNSLESFLITFSSSALWELMEYHEVFSINDQILTPVGGYVLGEASYQISCALLQKDSVLAKSLGYGMNPMLGINHLLDKRKTGNKFESQPDCSKTRWSEISMYLGLERGQKSYDPADYKTYIAGLDARVMNIDDYNKPGQASRLVYDTAMVKALVEKTGGDGAGDIRVIAQIVAAAYNQKRIDYDSQGQLRGYDITIGLGSGSTWYDHGTAEKTRNEDFYGTINVLGATAHASLFYKGFHIQAEFSFYGDLAMVKSWALNDFKDSRGGVIDDQLSVIRKRGYYYGLGTTALSGIAIEKGRWTVGYSGQYSSAKDISSRQRNEDNNPTNPASFEDSFSSHRFFVKFKITKNFNFQVMHEVNTRDGSANGVSSPAGTERRTMGVLVYLF